MNNPRLGIEMADGIASALFGKPALCDPQSNPLPYDYTHEIACDDCGVTLPFCEMHDTIVGFLCDGCNKRFSGACAGFLEHSAKLAELRRVK